MPVVTARTRRTQRLAALILPTLIVPGEAPADRMAAARILDREQSTSLTGLPAHTAAVTALRRAIDPAPGTRLLAALVRSNREGAALLALSWARGLEPLPRGPQTVVPVPLRALRGQKRVERPELNTVSRRTDTARQGRLGDCWFIAVLAACELTRPGFMGERIKIMVHSTPARASLATIELFAPIVTTPLARRVPFLPVSVRRVVASTSVPVRHRAGDAGLRPSAASLIEKAAVVVWADGSYRRLQNDFAGIGFLLLTGRWCPARPVPRSVTRVQEWLELGRPVVLSTLKRPGGSFTLDREDGNDRKLAFMDAHVYVAVRALHCNEDGKPQADQPLRLHVRNPLGGPENRALRKTNLYLSAAQLRRAFISVNVGPSLG